MGAVYSCQFTESNVGALLKYEYIPLTDCVEKGMITDKPSYLREVKREVVQWKRPNDLPIFAKTHENNLYWHIPAPTPTPRKYHTFQQSIYFIYICSHYYIITTDDIIRTI